MRARWPLIVAWLSGVGLAIVLVVRAAITDVVWLAHHPSEPSFAPFANGVASVAAVQVTAGAVILARRPGNVIGRIMMAGGALLAISFTGWAVTGERIITAGLWDPVGGLAAVVGAAAIFPAALSFGGVAMLFPDGRLPSPIWRWPLRVIVGLVTAVSALAFVAPASPSAGVPRNPLALDAFPTSTMEVAYGVGSIATMAALALGLVGLAMRFHRARGIERAQLKWLFAAFALFAPLFVVSWTGQDSQVVDVLGVLSALAIPAAICVAILRYRLFDIDRIVSRTLAYALLTGGLLALFAGLVVALQTALAGIAQLSSLPVAISTLVVAATFQLLRRRIQDIVDRRFDRARYDGQLTAAAFADRLRDEVDLDHSRRILVDTAAAAVRPRDAGVWLRVSDGGGG